MAIGRTIKLFLVDGTPTGILTAEIMNWTGHVLVAPRSRIVDLIKREEVRRTGIYFLIGSDPEIVYIGESDDVGNRLKQHNRDDNKIFWERACVVTSKDQNLTKAHVRYLESRLIKIAHESGRAQIHNETSPDYGYLPEADIADMEFFLDQIKTVLPVLSWDFLKQNISPSLQIETTKINLQDQTNNTSPIFEINSKKHAIKATAQEIDGDFIVFSNSQAQKKWIGDSSSKTSYWRLHNKLVENNTIEDKGDLNRIFKEDCTFNSPSAASAVIFGRSDNGRKSWKIQGSSQTYAEWQDAQIEEIENKL